MIPVPPETLPFLPGGLIGPEAALLADEPFVSVYEEGFINAPKGWAACEDGGVGAEGGGAGGDATSSIERTGGRLCAALGGGGGGGGAGAVEFGGLGGAELGAALGLGGGGAGIDGELL